MSGKTSQLRERPQWLPSPPEPRGEETLVGALVKTAIGATIGALVFFGLGHRVFGVVIWVITALIGIVTLGSRRGRTGVARFFGALGLWVGRLLAFVLLTPIFLVGFTIARLVSRLSGRDPLHLRTRDEPTFWHPSDRDARKRRYIRAMFTTETPRAGGRGWLTALVALVVIVGGAELLLRGLGFGSPILYVPDVTVGYYPAPNQEVRRYGGRVHINEYGMRAPDYPREKPPDAFRVFMIGDSTLYGGSYMDQDELYARRLERALADGGGGDVEVLNIGVNGWGPYHKLGYVEKFGAFDADVAVICLPYGDVFRELSGIHTKPYFPHTRPPRLGLEEVFHHVDWRLRARGAAPTPEAREAQGERGVRAYVELARALRARGCEVLVEILPTRAAGTGEAIPETERRWVAALREALEAENVPVGYRAGLFKDRGAVDELYHDGAHLDALGHELYAEYLRERLASLSTRYRRWAGDALARRDAGDAS